MRIKSSIMLGILLSFMTLCAVRADNLLTSKSYVDAQDALKQNKITAAGDPNNLQGGDSIVTRTRSPGDVAEVWIAYSNEEMFGAYDGTSLHPTSVPLSGVVAENLVNLYDRMTELETNLAPVMDPLNTKFQTKIPNPGSGMLVVYDGIDEDNQTQFTGKYVRNQFDCGYIDGQGCSAEYNRTDIPNMSAVAYILDELYSAVQETQGALLNSINNGTPGAIVTYGVGSSLDERAILDGQYAAGNSDNIPTAGAVAAAVQTIGNQPISVMECANPECTLWNISQRTVLSPNNNAPYSGSAFVNPADYTGYTPSNP